MSESVRSTNNRREENKERRRPGNQHHQPDERDKDPYHQRDVHQQIAIAAGEFAIRHGAMVHVRHWDVGMLHRHGGAVMVSRRGHRRYFRRKMKSARLMTFGQGFRYDRRDKQQQHGQYCNTGGESLLGGARKSHQNRNCLSVRGGSLPHSAKKGKKICRPERDARRRPGNINCR